MAFENNPDSEHTAAVFAALSNPTRLEIIRMLDIRPRTVTEIVDFFMLAQSTISRHLEVLRNTGLVSVSKDAQKRIYSLNPSALRETALSYLNSIGSIRRKPRGE